MVSFLAFALIFWFYILLNMKPLSVDIACLLGIHHSDNKKCSPWKVFGINHPQNLRLLSRRGPRRLGPETVLTLYWPKNDMLPFFIFQIFWLGKKTPVHFYTILLVVICKRHVARPLHSFNKYRKFLLSNLEFYSAEIWKMSECHFVM